LHQIASLEPPALTVEPPVRTFEPPYRTFAEPLVHFLILVSISRLLGSPSPARVPWSHGEWPLAPQWPTPHQWAGLQCVSCDLACSSVGTCVDMGLPTWKDLAVFRGGRPLVRGTHAPTHTGRNARSRVGGDALYLHANAAQRCACADRTTEGRVEGHGAQCSNPCGACPVLRVGTCAV